MKKILVLIVLAAIIYLIVQYNGTQKETSDATIPDTICAGMGLTEAIDIAQLGCGSEGTLTENAFCNDGTETWWIDMIPLEEKE
ncbi:hypothetical protein KKG31_01935 [Patescibacteria group bacterium]|nr:hypothetical protein [Patescibacteria group bacterium]MBU1757932.1 hypothetical protein [Patescibacteria group bacterium]